MPAALVKSFAARAGISTRKAEKLWDRAVEIAADQGHKEDYAYIVGVLKRMLGIRESELSSDSRSFSETKAVNGEQYIYTVSRREFPLVIDSVDKLERWLVDRGLTQANFKAWEDSSFFMIDVDKTEYRTLETLLNTEGIQYESVCTDRATDLIEFWGAQYTRRMLFESIPPNVRASLLMRYLQLDKQIRAAARGQVDYNVVALNLRQAVYTLLNWLAKKDAPRIDVQKTAGII